MDEHISSTDWDFRKEAAEKWVDSSMICTTGLESLNMVSATTKWLNWRSSLPTVSLNIRGALEFFFHINDYAGSPSTVPAGNFYLLGGWPTRNCGHPWLCFGDNHVEVIRACMGLFELEYGTTVPIVRNLNKRLLGALLCQKSRNTYQQRGGPNKTHMWQNRKKVVQTGTHT